MNAIESARLKLSQIEPATAAIEADRAARYVAKTCDKGQVADLINELLDLQEQAAREVQRCETRMFVLRRALELQSYK